MYYPCIAIRAQNRICSSLEKCNIFLTGSSSTTIPEAKPFFYKDLLLSLPPVFFWSFPTVTLSSRRAPILYLHHFTSMKQTSSGIHFPLSITLVPEPFLIMTLLHMSSELFLLPSYPLCKLQWWSQQAFSLSSIHRSKYCWAKMLQQRRLWVWLSHGHQPQVVLRQRLKKPSTHHHGDYSTPSPCLNCPTPFCSE